MPMTVDQRKAMLFQRPSAIPIAVGILPAAWMLYREELDALLRRHPAVFPDYRGNKDYDAVWTESYHVGDHVDDWGCVWSNIQDGVEAIVTGHPVPTREAVRTLKAPTADKPELKHGFMYLRLADLRGFEEIMLDFAEEPPELQMLIDLVLGHVMGRLETLDKKLAKDDMFWFGDDLGMQKGLAMGADKWRKYMRPCFAKIFGRWRETGRDVYFHTDGCIHEIIPDLIECGVQIINPQFRSNGIDNLVRVCKGKVCCDLDLDRQLFPFVSPKDIDDHIRECVMKMGSREGGLWIRAECGQDVPLENMDAIFTALTKYRSYWTA